MSKPFLSDLVHYRTYAKYLPEEQRRENKKETIDRYVDMMVRKYPNLEDDIRSAAVQIYEGRVVPSMRAFQFAGEAMERRHNRGYNCAYLALRKYKSFADLFFQSMSGCGVGFSVQKHHVDQIPEIAIGGERVTYVIPDSAEGWCDSLLALFANHNIQFDYSEIRGAGEALSTGGTASGPKALTHMHSMVREILRKAEGRKLRPFECLRIACLIADCVVVGGVRRGALICLFDADDQEVLHAKATGFDEKYPEFWRANISAVVHKDDPNFEQLAGSVIDACFAGGQSEPGLSLTRNKELGWNPCHEISLRDMGVCNLTEINAAKCFSQDEFFAAAWSAAVFGTLQASFTDFKYVDPEWKRNAEEEALLGVSITGQAENQAILTEENLQQAAKLCVQANKDWANALGINPAKRVTTTKPSGTASSWLGTTAGIHAGHDKWYLRRVRMEGDSALAKFLQKKLDGFVVQDPNAPDKVIVQVPIELYENTLLRTNETAIQLLERTKFLYQHWIVSGHVEGDNTHNISLTVNYHPHEKEAIREWMLKNKEFYYGISLMPFDGGDYSYLPYSLPIHKEVFKLLKSNFVFLSHDINFDDIKERRDYTNFKGEAACAGGACELQL